ncbi:phage tail protein [uncultured Paenibacillus sp.]|uniref:phage tail protein n=1 Tax=uncultured Paenibacillus sp. TaxID=227322 RepID=UPI002045F458|nr:phage tail protein [uncultured Paenibacillus sp.]DAI82627.1 MAG TPA: tail fiber repeat protein [Caudoviricetes sp.]
MATNTPNLNLLKKDPVADGNETFNIQTMLNENWDKIDAAVGEMDIPDASLTAKGKVQLSSETDSDAEDRAATPKAVSEIALQAKSYTDQQIGLVTETGIPKLVSYPLLVTATTDGQTEYEIPLELFDANTDTLLVSVNRATLDSTRYTVTSTVRDGSGQVTQRAKITLLSGIKAGSKVAMVVLKNVPIGPEGAINGAVLAVDSVPINRVNGLKEKLDAQLAEKANVTDYVRQPAYATTSGTATAYTVTLTPAPTTLLEGFGITIVPHVDCEASPSLKIGSLTPVPLKDQKGNAYAAGKLLAGKPYAFRLVGSDFLADSGSGAEGNATANDIRVGKTATVSSGEVITGALAERATTTITPSTSTQNFPAGIYSSFTVGAVRRYRTSSYVGAYSSVTVSTPFQAQLALVGTTYPFYSAVAIKGFSGFGDYAFKADSTSYVVSIGTNNIVINSPFSSATTVSIFINSD